VADPTPLLTELLALPHPTALDAGTPNRAAGDRLRGIDAAELFAPAAVRDEDAARACLAGLWLKFDYLDESHRIAQDVHTADGSFWHGIMHRREGDYGNAKYWFRRVGPHPVLAQLAAEAGWDPFDFVDQVEACVTRNRGDVSALQSLQQREWQLLFDHCRSRATGR